MTSPLLINEPPLQLLPSLANIVGLNEALILQQVHYWISARYNNNVFEGRKWVYNTYEQWREQFPFWSKSTIERTIIKLERANVLLSREGEKRLKHYTIDYETLNSFVEERGNDKKKRKIHSDTTSNCGDDVSRQNDAMVTSNCGDGHVKLTRSYIDTENTQRLTERDARARANESFSENSPLTEAKDSLSRKEQKRGSSLDINWTLPDGWREWSIQCGMMNEEIDITEIKFRNYWLSTNNNAIKKDWFRTWQNWCVNEYERKGSRLNVKNAVPQKPVVYKPNPEFVKTKSSDNPKIQRWYELQPKLRSIMGDVRYESWIEKHLELIRADGKAVFKASSNFTRDYIYTNFRGEILTILAEVDPRLGIESNVEFIV